MKVLVTGGCGFIGHALCKKLIKNGKEVHIVDNLSIGKEAKVADGCTFLGGDVRAMENIPLNSYKYIFHLAALSRIQPSFKNPRLTFSCNVEGTKQVVEYALKTNAKLIYAGSSSHHHDPELSPYAMTKHIGEEWVKMYKKVFNLDAEIARFYNVYGPGELVDSNMAAVIGLWRAAIKERKPVKIYGDGEQRRDFTHIDDIVDGLVRIANSSEKHEAAWELGTGTNYSINELYRMFSDKSGVDCTYFPDQPGNYPKTIRVNNDALNKLNWSPKDRLRDYILNL